MSGGSVLVIDDDLDFRQVLCGELEQAGYAVAEAADGSTGVERLIDTDVDVVVLDVQMPGLDGSGVIREARLRGAKAEIVVMTAYPKLDTALQCLDAGVCAFLEKPFKPQTLICALDSAIERRRLRAATDLYVATRGIFSDTGPELLPQRIVEMAMRTLDADDASLMLPSSDGGLYIACSHGLPLEVSSRVRVEVGQGVAGVVAGDLRPALFKERSISEPRFAGIPPSERVRSSIVFPLAVGARLVGVLNVNRVGLQRPFRESDLELAGILASQALLALENVSLLRRLLRTERLAFLGKLTAELSHEVANPCSYVIANLEYLVQALPAGEHLQSAEDALDGARRIARVVKDMRALVRGDGAGMRPVELNAAARAALRLSAGQLKGLQIHQSLGEPELVMGDEGRLTQVFVNLLVNAAQALEGRADGEVRLSASRQGKILRAVVEDNGPGIPLQDQARIFDGFFTTKHGQSGTGLGLSISREIARRHGGDLLVESSEGHGSRFILVLPAPEQN